MKHLALEILKNPSIQALPELLAGGSFPALVSGLSPVPRANLCAALRLETELPLAVICPDEAALEAMARDLTGFLEEEPVTLGSREYAFYSVESVSRQGEQKRILALDALNQGRTPVVLATVAGLMQRTIPPETLQALAFEISMDGTQSPEAIENRLLENGYLRTEQVEGPGQYSRRGGILDLFSPAHDQPVRMEFWGDEIDSMGFFDPDTQRRTEAIQSCRVLPAAETVVSACPGGAEALGQKLRGLAGKISKSARRADLIKLRDVLMEDSERLCTGSALPAADRYMELIYPQFATALDYLSPETLVILAESNHISQRAEGAQKQLHEDLKLLMESGILHGSLARFGLTWAELCGRLEDYPVILADNFTVGRYALEPKSILSLTCKQLPSYGGSVETAVSDVEQYLKTDFGVVVLAGDARKAQVLENFLRERKIDAVRQDTLQTIPQPGQCVISIGGLTAGLEYPEIHLAVLTDTQFVRTAFSPRKSKRKKAGANRQKLSSYADLSVGDLVVHEHHGIGRFAGIIKMPVDGVEKDYIKICYAGTDSLYVPATQLDLVSKYIGAGEDRPVKLSRMGGTDWAKAKTRAKAAAKEMASELIALYARRQRQKGHAFAPDSPWQIEFEDSFGYTETDDQLRCIAEIKEDMEKETPMDRLLCGDVGYGKTEVALRAVMKCVLDGMQAAILVPTTVLAQQHYQTAVQRFFGYPVNIQVLSRFRTPSQVKQTLRDIRSGAVDIVIGTHKLLQKDVVFKNLGLLVVDEEQRFGVSHKEHIKEISQQVDVLTLSATPIPRTLNMALSGIRDMSTIEEPPQARMPVQTFVMEHDWTVICDAIRREIQRGGQVYYLHNRVDSIERTASRLSRMLENVTVGVAHGKMDEESLSGVMESVMNGETQVLVCTTIIETGIDIPNVNTLIIEDADRLGLAQLHQIRGRVGRSTRRAAAYFTFRRDKVLSEVAEKRLSAIREFAEFGSGFKIAMRDLEIRGAGNLLGAEQSGHMIDVGYDMYLKLLEEAVLEEKGEKVEVRTECAADLAVSANIPERYVRSPEQRMDLYRRIALIRTEEDADDLTDELIDRFGDPPPGVNALIHVALLRGEATRAGIADISQKAGYLNFELTDFDFNRVSILYGESKYKGRVKVEAGSKPRISLRLVNKKRVIDEAREFVRAWLATAPETGEAETMQS
jgi:transcription-repair coupling factor (superfamily II helicase)